MRFAISVWALFFLLLLAPLVRAQGPPPQRARAKAAALLALAKAQRERCEACTPSPAKAEALARLQECRSGDCLTDLARAQEVAAQHSKPLFVWVGLACDEHVRQEFQHAVHCHVSHYNGDATRQLVVGARGQWWKVRAADVGPGSLPVLHDLVEGRRPALAPGGPLGPPPAPATIYRGGYPFQVFPSTSSLVSARPAANC